MEDATKKLFDSTDGFFLKVAAELDGYEPKDDKDFKRANSMAGLIVSCMKIVEMRREDSGVKPGKKGAELKKKNLTDEWANGLKDSNGATHKN